MENEIFQEMMKGLTKKQSGIYDYIKQYIEQNKYSPSYEEIKKEIKLSSKSGVHIYIKSLEERGWITRISGKARSIKLIK